MLTMPALFPPQVGMLTVGRLKAAVLSGDLLPAQQHAAELLQVLDEFVVPGPKTGGLWG